MDGSWCLSHTNTCHQIPIKERKEKSPPPPILWSRLHLIGIAQPLPLGSHLGLPSTHIRSEPGDSSWGPWACLYFRLWGKMSWFWSSIPIPVLQSSAEEGVEDQSSTHTHTYCCFTNHRALVLPRELTSELVVWPADWTDFLFGC